MVYNLGPFFHKLKEKSILDLYIFTDVYTLTLSRKFELILIKIFKIARKPCTVYFITPLRGIYRIAGYFRGALFSCFSCPKHFHEN